jgi:hypothetical protein
MSSPVIYNTTSGLPLGPGENWPVSANRDGVQWLPKVLPDRKKTSTLGKPTDVEINCYDAVFFKFNDPKFRVYQWDVKLELKFASTNPKPPKRAFKEVVWQSSTVQQKLGNGWIYNGDAIAWWDRSSSANVYVAYFIIGLWLLLVIPQALKSTWVLWTAESLAIPSRFFSSS